jgi:hypothetical protein
VKLSIEEYLEIPPGVANNADLERILKMDRSTYLNETHTRKLEHTYILEVTF